MNMPILDPLQGDFPEVIEDFLQHGNMKCIAFNRHGTLLAAGCADGKILIWDFETRGISKTLRDKDSNAPITSVCWSNHGQHLLASATDKSLALWDVLNSSKITKITLQLTALHSQLSPLGSNTCLSCPLSSAPLLVDLNTGDITALPVSVSQTGNNYAITPNVRNKFSDGSLAFTPTAGAFDKSGELVYVGNSKGEILIVGTKTRTVHAIVPVPGGAVIKDLVFSRNGQFVLTNSNDRVIRLFQNLVPSGQNVITNLEKLCNTNTTNNDNDNNNVDFVEKLRKNGAKCMIYLREFQDVVTKMQWKTPCFSGDGEWIMGASATKGEHKLYIWERLGHLVKLLEGPKEATIDLAWHPKRPIVVSVSVTGTAYIWAKDYVENWSAFAPDFKELEENEEYVEREDEFDANPRDEEKEKEEEQDINEDEEVDILNIEKDLDGSDSEEELCYLPAVPSPEKYSSSPYKPESGNRSGSPVDDMDTDVLQNGQASSPMDDGMENGSNLDLDEGEIGSSSKRKRKPTVKGLEMQAEKDRRPLTKIKPSFLGRNINKNGSDQEDEFTDGCLF
ncbi:hypothetical protein LUZ60_005925 [Juncus effusus]|nr:hypothetical protein LUZ60_005925 [Juncus effusus]